MSLKSIIVLLPAILAVSCDAPPDPRRTNFKVEKDGVVAQYDDKTGRLKKLDVDLDKNGRIETWSYWDGTKIQRIEMDKDENGVLDRWEHYAGTPQIVKLGTSSRNDGVEDTWEYPGPDGILARKEYDTDRDGKVDKWEEYGPSPTPGAFPVLRSVALDLEKTGKPQRWLYYRADGSFERSEILR